MVLNSGLRGLMAGHKKTANSGLNEAIAAKLHMNSNASTMPQTAIAGYSGSYSGRFRTLNLQEVILLPLAENSTCSEYMMPAASFDASSPCMSTFSFDLTIAMM